MSYGQGWGGSPWGGGESFIPAVDPVLYDVLVEDVVAATSDVFIGLQQIPFIIAGAQSRLKVEVVFSVGMSIDSNFLNPANYTITQVEGSVFIPVLSVTPSGTAPLRRATLEIGIPLNSKDYYFLTVAPSIVSLTGDPSDPDYTKFQWADMTEAVFRTPLVIPIKDFSGEVHGGILGQPDGLLFFSPALEDVASTSTIEVEQVSACTRAYDVYEMPNPPDPTPLLTWGPGISSVTGPTSVLWATADRLGLPRMDLEYVENDNFQPAFDFNTQATLVETIDITKGGFMNDIRWGTFPATGKTVFTTAANQSPIGPGPTTQLKLDWPKIYLSDSATTTDQIIINAIDLEVAENIDIIDDVVVQNITSGNISVTVDNAILITDTLQVSFQYNRALAADAVVMSDSTLRDRVIHRTFSDTVSVTDQVTIVAGVTYDVVASDTLTVTEQVSLSLAYNLTVADTLTTADTTARSIEYGRTLADTVVVTDESGAIIQGDLILEEAISITDSTVIQLYGFYSVTLSDSVSVTDDKTLDFYISSADSVSVTDETAVNREADRSVSDTAALTDSVALDLDYSYSISDTVSITDTVSALSTVDVAVNDTLTITDVNSIQVDKAAFDSIVITESLLLEMQVNLTLSDTPVITDSVALSSEYAVSGSDTIVTPDFVVAGAPMKYHTTTFSPVALWQLNGNLNDSSGNGFTLTLESGGTARYLNNGPGAGDLKGFLFDGVTRLVYNTTGSSLQITGDVTIEMIITLAGYSANSVLFSYGGNNTTTATNLLYNLALATTDGVGLTWSSEHGTAVLDTYTSTLASIPIGVPCHFAVTRTSDVIQFYLNGQAIGAASSALTTPTGGTSSVFHLGGEVGTGTNFVPKYSSIASVKVIASALSSAQVLSEYQATLGQYYG